VAVYPEDIIAKTIAFVKSETAGEPSGHDWWHIYRVHKMAVYLAAKENADIFIVELAALLHDLDDWKLSESGSCHAFNWLCACGLDSHTIEQITHVIGQVSFKGAGETIKPDTIEGQVVQDADRLDAIGAVGIARAFAYGGYKNRELFHPDVPPGYHADFDAYKSKHSHTINHFYEKLLLLKDRMNTISAKQLAEHRHIILEGFLIEFYAEWYFNDRMEAQK